MYVKRINTIALLICLLTILGCSTNKVDDKTTVSKMLKICDQRNKTLKLIQNQIDNKLLENNTEVINEYGAIKNEYKKHLEKLEKIPNVNNKIISYYKKNIIEYDKLIIYLKQSQINMSELITKIENIIKLKKQNQQIFDKINLACI